MGRRRVGLRLATGGRDKQSVGSADRHGLRERTPACSYATIRAAIDNALNGQTISIAPGRYSEHSLTIPGLSGATSVTLQGAGADRTTIDGTNIARVLEISSNASVAISGITITGGNADLGPGGGIENLGTLTVANSAVAGSSATFGGAIGNVGTLILTSSSVTGNRSFFIGGGIDNSGTLKLNRSTLSANTAANVGGGLANVPGATAQLNSTTVSGNTAPGSDRGPGSGGGIANLRSVTGVASLTLNNSTVNANTATMGGGILTRASMTLNHSTVSANTATGTGGGILAGFPFTAHNSQIVGNQPDECVGLC